MVQGRGAQKVGYMVSFFFWLSHFFSACQEMGEARVLEGGLESTFAVLLASLRGGVEGFSLGFTEAKFASSTLPPPKLVSWWIPARRVVERASVCV